MSANTPKKLPRGRTNQAVLILILMAVVLGLVALVLALPGFNIPALPTPVPTLPGAVQATPDAAQLTATALVSSPPVVHVESIVITGGVLVMIVLAAILREILQFRDSTDEK